MAPTDDRILYLVFFHQARAEAKALDAEFASTRSVRGPLHGVPVSFKDICEWLLRPMFDFRRMTRSSSPDNVEGFDTTMGFSSLAHKPSFEDAKVRYFLSRLTTIQDCPVSRASSLYCTYEMYFWPVM